MQRPVGKGADAQKMFGVASDEVLNEELAKRGNKFEEFKDENGFDKTNTNFYVKDGESVDIVFLSENPYMVKTHGITKTVKKKDGTFVKFFPEETCQKIEGSTCILCDASKSIDTIKAANLEFFYPIISLQGARHKETKEFVGGEAPAFFKPNRFVLGRIAELKNEYGSDFCNLVFSLTKVGKNVVFEVKMKKVGIGRDQVSKPMIYDKEYKGKLPDFMTIWQPKDSETLEAQYLKD